MNARDNAPLVSAVVTTYRRPQLAKRAIESALAQDHAPLEVIVVEDGSQSDLPGWLEAQRPQIHYLRHESNRGLAAARNSGWKRSCGKYVAFLDDDDLWKPERISAQLARWIEVDQAHRERLGVVYCGIETHFCGRSFVTLAHPSNRGNLAESIAKRGIHSLSSTGLFLRAALEAVGGFDEMLSSCIDDDIWMQLAAAGYHADYVDLPLVISWEQRQQKRMTSDVEQRLAGVQQFVDKWRPTFVEWWGEHQGERFARRYYARVIAALAARKVAAGRFRQAKQAASAALSHNGNLLSSTLTLGRATGAALAYRLLPDPVLALLRRLLIE